MRRQRAVVLGLAREGVSLARYLADNGATLVVTDVGDRAELQDRVAAIDRPEVRYELGRHCPDVLNEADVLYVSPGVPPSNPVYARAIELGTPIRSMTTLFFDLCPGPIVGITGSSGKTTTTGLIGHILRESGRDVVVGGNIGDPMLDLLPAIGPDTTVVLELSSFQLEILRKSPHVAIVTNISPNHLDRHESMEAYVAAKLHIAAHQGADDVLILNARDPWSSDFAAASAAEIGWFNTASPYVAGIMVLDGNVTMVTTTGVFTVMPLNEIPLLGRHNVENVLAAVAAVIELGVPIEVIRAAVATFAPAPHRLQVVGVRDGVRYIDDSIATTPARAGVALEAIDAPVILIAGGRDKQLPWCEFAEAIVKRARAALLLGEAARKIETALHKALDNSPQPLVPPVIERCGSIEDAVNRAHEIARPGDVVLLSPACASYDMFRDFEERGAAFARAVEALDAA